MIMLDVASHQVPQVNRSKVRLIGAPTAKKYPMVFFDGAAPDSIGGASVCIWLNDHHFLYIKLGCGHNTNTRVELLALWASLHIAKDIGLPYLHIFGDSSVIINWAKEESTLAIVNLYLRSHSWISAMSIGNIILGKIHYPSKGFIWI